MAWISAVDIRTRLAFYDPNGSHTDDALLTVAAAEACEWVERYSGRKFERATYTRIFNGTGTNVQPLPVTPVISLVSLINGMTIMTVGTADTYRQGLCQAFADTENVRANTIFPRGFANVKVTWVAGYTTIPESIKGLASAVAILRWKHRDRYGDQTKTLPGQVVSYVQDLVGQDKVTAAQLIDYRNYYIDQGVDV